MAHFRRGLALAASVEAADRHPTHTPEPRPRVEPWITAGELAELLDVSTDWVYEKAASGELPSYLFGGHRRFRLSEVEGWAGEHACGRGARRNGQRGAG